MYTNYDLMLLKNGTNVNFEQTAWCAEESHLYLKMCGLRLRANTTALGLITVPI